MNTRERVQKARKRMGSSIAVMDLTIETVLNRIDCGNDPSNAREMLAYSVSIVIRDLNAIVRHAGASPYPECLDEAIRDADTGGRAVRHG